MGRLSHRALGEDGPSVQACGLGAGRAGPLGWRSHGGQCPRSAGDAPPRPSISGFWGAQTSLGGVGGCCKAFTRRAEPEQGKHLSKAGDGPYDRTWPKHRGWAPHLTQGLRSTTPGPLGTGCKGPFLSKRSSESALLTLPITLAHVCLCSSLESSLCLLPWPSPPRPCSVAPAGRTAGRGER